MLRAGRGDAVRHRRAARRRRARSSGTWTRSRWNSGRAVRPAPRTATAAGGRRLRPAVARPGGPHRRSRVADSRRPDGTVGEIWVARAVGRPGLLEPARRNRRRLPRAARRTGDGPFLRTGDLGFAPGRRAVRHRADQGPDRHPRAEPLPAGHRGDRAGRAPGLRPGCGAAFEVDRDGRPRLVVVQEVDRRGRSLDAAQMAGDIRQAVAERHELQVYDVVLLEPGSIPKTSSGKVRRRELPRGVRERGAAPWKGRADMTPSAEEIESWIVDRVSRADRRAGRPRWTCAAPLTRHGLDSVALIALAADLEKWLGYRFRENPLDAHPDDRIARPLPGGGESAAAERALSDGGDCDADLRRAARRRRSHSAPPSTRGEHRSGRGRPRAGVSRGFALVAVQLALILLVVRDYEVARRLPLLSRPVCRGRRVRGPRLPAAPVPARVLLPAVARGRDVRPRLARRPPRDRHRRRVDRGCVTSRFRSRCGSPWSASPPWRSP